MALIRHIKTERGQKKRKSPFRRQTFALISALVKDYGLGEEFLSRLANFTDDLLKESLEYGRPKNQLALPLFCLGTEEQYQVTRTIMTKVNNPYLPFARSPEEILLCRPLYELNSAIEPDILARYHFATLLRSELDR
jgi:hypothetical protein